MPRGTWLVLCLTHSSHSMPYLPGECWAPSMHLVTCPPHPPPCPVSPSPPLPLSQSAGLCSLTSVWPVVASFNNTSPFLTLPLSPLGSLKVSQHTGSSPLSTFLVSSRLKVERPLDSSPPLSLSHSLSPHLDMVFPLNWVVTLLPAYCPALGASFSQLVA